VDVNKKFRYSWIVFWIVVNILIWAWGSGFISRLMPGQAEQAAPVRTLEQINQEAVSLTKSSAKETVKAEGSDAAAPATTEGTDTNKTELKSKKTP
jgi:cytoskeletal protein RodZ